MNEATYRTLEFNKVLERIADYARSKEAKKQILALKPLTRINAIQNKINEVDDGRWIVESRYTLPIHSMTGVADLLHDVETGRLVSTKELNLLCEFLEHCERIRRFMEKHHVHMTQLGYYAEGFSQQSELMDTIYQTVEGERIRDEASPYLSKLRKKSTKLEERIRLEINSYFRQPQTAKYMQENQYKRINGCYTLPVLSTYKNQIKGTVISQSGSGQTVYIQPDRIQRFQIEYNQLMAEEEQEIIRILSEISNAIYAELVALKKDAEIMVQYDSVMAKAKYSADINGMAAQVNKDGCICLNKVKHPLLGDEAVAIDVVLKRDQQGLLITGPNTGGKTVTLKTVGLSILMGLSGLHISAEAYSTIPMVKQIFADIGDGQNLEQSLSTFSSHIKNIKEMLQRANQYTLVIIDEIGTGTDPAEGAGLGIAIIENLLARQSKLLATTHYNQIKEFAKGHPLLETGSMAFDLATLKPLYQLRIGNSGDSNAFFIALKLGIDYRVINRAHKISYNEDKNYKPYLEQPAFRGDHTEMEPVEKPVLEVIHTEKKVKEAPKINVFDIGDAVYVGGIKGTAVIVGEADRKGNYTLLYKGKKIQVNHKRLKLYLAKDELYPEGYDMDVITKSKDYRKNKKRVDKGKRDAEVIIE